MGASGLSSQYSQSFCCVWVPGNGLGPQAKGDVGCVLTGLMDRQGTQRDGTVWITTRQQHQRITKDVRDSVGLKGRNAWLPCEVNQKACPQGVGFETCVGVCFSAPRGRRSWERIL